MCALNISSSPKSHLSRIESLIQDENCSLDDLLSEDDFVTAVLNKGGEFLSLYANLNNSINRERFKQIILYITTDPDPDGDIIEVYKYPFISSRLLSADSPLLNLYFSKEGLRLTPCLPAMFPYVTTCQTQSLHYAVPTRRVWVILLSLGYSQGYFLLPQAASPHQCCPLLSE